MKAQLQNQAGSTLIEVLVAMMILAVGLMGLLGMSSDAMRMALRNDDWTNARMLAQSVLETSTAAAFDDLHLEAAATPYTIDSMLYDDQVFAMQIWRQPLGDSRAPVRVSVRVFPIVDNDVSKQKPFSDSVSITTVKTFYL
jgi:prepilin-type N-terminal cleavage/methylation domain-containing protein